MPIPFIIAGLAVVAGGLGVAGALDAKEKMDEAKEVGEEGEEIVKNAKARCERKKNSTNQAVETLGKTKLEILSNNMSAFVADFSKIKNVNFKDSIGMEELQDFTPQSESIGALKIASVNAVDLGGGLASGVVGGGIAALGAYGAVGLLGTASTGTAIGTLSGAAATNATLAWFGGGSLAAGGLGMAGGAAILGGLVAGPALLIGGFILSNKADEELSKAMTYWEEARTFEAKCDNICSLLSAIQTRAGQIIDVLLRLDCRFSTKIENMKNVIEENGTDWNVYSVEQKKCIGEAAMVAKTLKAIMDTPLLHEDGTLNESSRSCLALESHVSV